MRASDTFARGKRTPSSDSSIISEREAEANRKLALQVLTAQRRPTTGGPKHSKHSYHSGHSGPSLTPSNYKRLPIDGRMRLGSDLIEWKQPPRQTFASPQQQHFVVPVMPAMYPMHPMMFMMPPSMHGAERTLAGRYQQLLYGRSPQQAYPSTSPNLTGEVHHHHHHVYHGEDEEVPGELPPHASGQGARQEARQEARHVPRSQAEGQASLPPEYSEEEEEWYGEEDDADEEDRRAEREQQAAAAKLQAHQRGHLARRELQKTTKTVPPPSEDLMPRLHASTPEALAKFRAALDCGDPHSEYHLEKRNALWASFDANGRVSRSRSRYLWLVALPCLLALASAAAADPGIATFDAPLASCLLRSTGRVTLAATNGGVMRALCKMWGREGDALFHRYYRSYIRAFSDAKDAARKVRADDDDVVTRGEFRLLIVYLGIYAAWYEVFLYVDWNLDHRLSRAEFIAALPVINECGRTWANSIAFANATAESFDEIDQNGGGYIDLMEFCEWAERYEKLGQTEQGRDLGVNEPIDRPSYGAHREWHGAKELEMRAVDRRRIEERRMAEERQFASERMRHEPRHEPRPRVSGMPMEMKPPGW